jgi:NAD(P)-dependent dehydrogenase (short-subunit alcohol dehydrogenase family)
MVQQARVALITGGQGDLAEATAAALQTQGCVVLTPGKAELDVTSADAVKRYFSELNRLDLLINNAGLREDHFISKLSEAAWQEVLNTNLKGAFLTSQAALKLMLRQRHGHIINVGSYSALVGPVGQANYAAAKAGLIALTQSLAQEVGSRNIRVNCVLPGWLETKFTHNVPPAITEAALAQHTLGRFNTVVEAARAITFLDTLENLSGQIIQLDSRISCWC